MTIESHTRSRPAAGANTLRPGENRVARFGAETFAARPPLALVARMPVLAIATTIVVTIVAAIAGCSPSPSSESGHAHDDHGHEEHGLHEDEAHETGPNNGRMLRDGDIAVELRIFESGVPPTWRGWVYRNGEPVAQAGELVVTTTRLGGHRTAYRLEPGDDHRQADGVVGEPHSFVVAVELALDGHAHRWQYESFEGRTRIAPDVAERSNIVTAPAGPATIRERHEAFGVLTPIEGRQARIGARFDGLVRAVDAGIGEAVRQGQRLALIESNQGLSEYPLIAPLDGVVLARNIEPGEVVSGGAVVFEIADLSELWVDLHVFGVDADRLEPGLPLQVSDIARDKSVETHIQRVLPTTATASQSTIARGVLDNADGRWRPGAAILAEVTLSEVPVALAVPLDALQTFRDWDVVFERVGDEYEARPVDLGRRDDRYVEVLSGLRPGAEVVAGQSYLIKADIEKAGATHDH